MLAVMSITFNAFSTAGHGILVTKLNWSAWFCTKNNAELA